MARDDDSGLKLEFICDNLFDVLERVGKMPLPPYMKRSEETSDRERYQTVYAEPVGSMAGAHGRAALYARLMSAIEARGAKIVR